MRAVTKTAVAILISFCLLACSQAPPGPLPVSITSTAIEGAEHDRSGQQMVVTVHVHRGLKELNEARDAWFKRYNLDPPSSFDKVLGWTVWSPQDNVCEIHISTIRSIEDRGGLQTAGHELSHCLYGGFHRE